MQQDNKPMFPDTQSKQQRAEFQELSRFASAPFLQASQQSRLTLESPSMLPKQKSFPVTTATSLPEKQLAAGLGMSPASFLPEKGPQFIQSRGLPLSQAVFPLEKQSQQNQSQRSIMGGRFEDQQQSEHCNNQANAIALSREQSQLQNQVSGRHPSHSPQDNFQGKSQGEIHQMHSEMGKQYSQQQENQQTDGLISRGKTLGTIKSLATSEIHGKRLLFALYDDGNLCQLCYILERRMIMERLYQ